MIIRRSLAKAIRETVPELLNKWATEDTWVDSYFSEDMEDLLIEHIILFFSVLESTGKFTEEQISE